MKAVVLLVLLVFATSVAGQPTAQEIASNTLAAGGGVVRDVVGSAEAEAARLEGASDASAWTDAAQAVGRFLQEVAGAVAGAVVAVARLTADVTVALAKAMGQLASQSATVAVATLSAIGYATGVMSDAIGRAVASAFAAALAGAIALLGGYASWAATLRPSWMPQPVFVGLAATGATTAVAAAAWGLWDLAKRLLGLLGIAGFSRIHDDEVLEHPMRRRIHDLIQEQPGIHASELTRRLGVGWGTVVHHLEKLEKARLVAVRRIHHQRCYFQIGGRVARTDMEAAGAVRTGSAQAIAQYVATHPMTSQKNMAGSLGMSPALASFHVKKLVTMGVLHKVRRGKETLLSPTDAVRRVLAPELAPAGVVPVLAPSVGARVAP